MTAILGSFLVATFMVACGGGGGGGSSAPQSSAAYAGSSMAAVIDTTSYSSDFEDLFNDIGLAAGMYEEGVWNLAAGDETGSSSESGSNVLEGSISGTWTETWSSNYNWSPTAYEDSYLDTETYSDYADSGDLRYPGVLTGAGSMYEASEYSGTYDYDTENDLTYSESSHLNYASFKETIGDGWRRTPSEESRDGYLKDKWMYDYVAGTWTGSQAANFSYAYAESGSDPVYVGLLNASLTASYDGTTATDMSTFAGTGTLCTEGDYEFSFYGCVDFVIDVSYEGDVDEPLDPPDSGTISVSTVDATAMYAFGTTPSFPDCIQYTVIEAGASSAILDTLVGTCTPQ